MLEKVCSSVFAVAFLLFMCILGTVVYLSWLINVPAILFSEIIEYAPALTPVLGIALALFLLVALSARLFNPRVD